MSARLKASGIAGSTVTLKLKTADFRIRTRARSLGEPTQLAARIFAAGRELARRARSTARKFRLIGIGVSNLDDADEADRADLVDRQGERAAEAEHAIDRVREKFGERRRGQGAGVRRLRMRRSKTRMMTKTEISLLCRASRS